MDTVKKYYCKRIDGSISIDGNVNKPEWKDAEIVSLVDTMTGAEPKQGTIAGLRWNDDYLYVSFLCQDTFINAKMTEYNDEIFKEEVVEIFVDDDSDIKTYIEIEVSPLNTLLHYGVQNNLKGNILLFARVVKKLETAVIRKDDEGWWSVEIAIPFTEFATARNIPPKPGDTWRFNLYRIDRPQNGEDEFTAWSPTVVRRYHTPQKFGELVFVE